MSSPFLGRPGRIKNIVLYIGGSKLKYVLPRSVELFRTIYEPLHRRRAKCETMFCSANLVNLQFVVCLQGSSFFYGATGFFVPLGVFLGEVLETLVAFLLLYLFVFVAKQEDRQAGYRKLQL